MPEPKKTKDELERLYYEQQLTLAGGGTVTNFPTSTEISNDSGNPIPASDVFLGGQALPDQSSTGSVLTFTFASPVHLIWVKPTGGTCRVDPFGGVPTSSTGIPCDDGIPNPLTVKTTAVQVFAASGVAVAVWGYRY